METTPLKIHLRWLANQQALHGELTSGKNNIGIQCKHYKDPWKINQRINYQTWGVTATDISKWKQALKMGTESFESKIRQAQFVKRGVVKIPG